MTLKDQFIQRGYNDTQVSTELNKASAMNREELLKPKANTSTKSTLTFVTTYNKALPNLSEILTKNWPLLQINTKISKSFSHKPTIAYKRNPNLKELIGQHRISNDKVVKKTKHIIGKCKPCRSQRGNKCCKQLKDTSTFSNRITGQTFNIFHQLSCKSRNTIYLLECTKCHNKAYTGKCETSANERINGHRSDARKTDSIPVDAHFLQPGHIFDIHAKFTLIEQITRKDLTKSQMTNLLKRREDFWILKLQTLVPNGFNIELNFPSNNAQ